MTSRSIQDIREERAQVLNKRDAVMDELRHLLDRNEWNQGVEERFRKLEKSKANYEGQIEALNDEWRSIIEDFASRPGHTEHGSEPDANGARLARTDAPPHPAGRIADEAKRAIEREPYSPDVSKHIATTLVERDPTGAAARWAAASADPDYATAFAKLVRDPQRGHMEFTAAEQRAFGRAQQESRAMGLDPDSSGGYMVPFTLDPSIIPSNDGVISPFRQIARRVTIATDAWHGVSSDGVSAEWKAEHAEVSAAEPVLDQPTIPVHFGDVFTPFSFEVGMDAPNLLAELRRLFQDAKDELEADAFLTGTGSGQPEGLLTALTTTQRVQTGSAGTYSADDVYAALEALPPRFRARAQWLLALPTINSTHRFQSDTEPALIDDSDRLLRKPLHETSEMEDTVATGNTIAVVGDFRHYVVVDRVGARIELVPHLFGANSRPTGQRGAFFWWRAGGGVTVANAFRYLEVA